MIGTIYAHINKTNGKGYVGQTWDVSVRWYPSRYKGCDKFHYALKKYGWGGFDHQIIIQQEMTQEELNNYEKLWIAVLNTTDPECGYNMQEGGNGIGRISEETRAKMSAAHKGLKQSPESIEKIRAFLKGRPKSPEHVAKMRGQKRSEETCRKISLAKIGKGHPQSEETRKKISEGQKALYAAGLRLLPHEYRKRSLENAQEG